MTSNNNSTDDGSLSFLNIQPDEANKHFNCPETTQQKLINLQFWLIDFIEDVKTKFGANRFLVKIKFKKDDPESEAKKFFTNSSEIKYILQEIKKRNAFPRKSLLSSSALPSSLQPGIPGRYSVLDYLQLLPAKHWQG